MDYTEGIIIRTKQELQGWTLTYTDKNPGMIVICCPQWYTDKMYETFNFVKQNSPY